MASTRLYSCTIDMEAVYGTGDGGPTAIALTNDCVPEIDKEDINLPVYTSSLGRPTSYVAFKKWNLPIKGFIKGMAGFSSGLTGWELGKMFRSFGLQQSGSTGVSQTFKVRDAGHESVTYTVNDNGIQYQVTGARGDELKLIFKAGRPGEYEGNVRGRYNAPTAVAYSVPTLDDSAMIPQNVVSMALTMNGVAHALPEITITIKNIGEYIEDINSANDGIKEYVITGREFTFEGTAIRDDSNDVEWWSHLTTPTIIAVASTGYGTAGGNKIDIDFANFQFSDLKRTQYKGEAAYGFKGFINQHVTAATEFQIKLT